MKFVLYFLVFFFFEFKVGAYDISSNNQANADECVKSWTTDFYTDYSSQSLLCSSKNVWLTARKNEKNEYFSLEAFHTCNGTQAWIWGPLNFTQPQHHSNSQDDSYIHSSNNLTQLILTFDLDDENNECNIALLTNVTDRINKNNNLNLIILDIFGNMKSQQIIANLSSNSYIVETPRIKYNSNKGIIAYSSVSSLTNNYNNQLITFTYSNNYIHYSNNNNQVPYSCNLFNKPLSQLNYNIYTIPYTLYCTHCVDTYIICLNTVYGLMINNNTNSFNYELIWNYTSIPLNSFNNSSFLISDHNHLTADPILILVSSDYLHHNNHGNNIEKSNNNGIINSNNLPDTYSSIIILDRNNGKMKFSMFIGSLNIDNALALPGYITNNNINKFALLLSSKSNTDNNNVEVETILVNGTFYDKDFVTFKRQSLTFKGPLYPQTDWKQSLASIMNSRTETPSSPFAYLASPLLDSDVNVYRMSLLNGTDIKVNFCTTASSGNEITFFSWCKLVQVTLDENLLLLCSTSNTLDFATHLLYLNKYQVDDSCWSNYIPSPTVSPTTSAPSPSPTPSNPSNTDWIHSTTGIIVTIIVSGLVLVFIVLLAIYCYRNRVIKLNLINSDSVGLLDHDMQNNDYRHF